MVAHHELESDVTDTIVISNGSTSSLEHTHSSKPCAQSFSSDCTLDTEITHRAAAANSDF